MSFHRDLSAALRATVRSPASSIPAVARLAVGTSGTIALVTLLSALVLRPLPVDRPGELVAVTVRDPGGQSMGFPVPFLPELAALSDVFDSTGLVLLSTWRPQRYRAVGRPSCSIRSPRITSARFVSPRRPAD